MIRIAVCEDDSMQREIVSALLAKYQAERPGIRLETKLFDSGQDMLEEMQKGSEYHLFLLDILLPGMNGIELARTIRKINGEVPLIFSTSSVDYALDAFKVSAAQYIVKPVRHEELFPVLDKVIGDIKQNKERFFLLNTQKTTIKIPYKSIICVELVRRTMRFYLDNGEVLQSSTIRVPFAEALGRLMEDERFLYEHKSFVLNMEHVDKVAEASFKLEGGVEVPIPRYNFARAKATYMTWLGRL